MLNQMFLSRTLPYGPRLTHKASIAEALGRIIRAVRTEVKHCPNPRITAAKNDCKRLLAFFQLVSPPTGFVGMVRCPEDKPPVAFGQACERITGRNNLSLLALR